MTQFYQPDLSENIDSPRADVLGFSNELKEVRDQCAHPGGANELMPKDRLAHFVQSAKRIRDSLAKAIQSCVI
jgi:hypothetical protein